MCQSYWARPSGYQKPGSDSLQVVDSPGPPMGNLRPDAALPRFLIAVNRKLWMPNLSGCGVPMPMRTNVLNLKGNVALVPWTGNLTSIATWVYAHDGANKAILYPGKIAATKGNCRCRPNGRHQRPAPCFSQWPSCRCVSGLV